MYKKINIYAKKKDIYFLTSYISVNKLHLEEYNSLRKCLIYKLKYIFTYIFINII